MGNQNGSPVLRQEDIQVLCNSSGLEEKQVWMEIHPTDQYKSDNYQVRECFDSFVSQHPNGRMKKGDFREMMEKVKYLLLTMSQFPVIATIRITYFLWSCLI